MTTEYETRYAIGQREAKQYDTQELRDAFLADKLMQPGKVYWIYSHYERFMVGGAVPLEQGLPLETLDALKSNCFSARREVGVINVGGPGKVTVNDTEYALDKGEALYIGAGDYAVTFYSDNADTPAHFYLNSAPAHASYPCKKVGKDDANVLHLGSPETANERDIHQLIINSVVQTCQLQMGLTRLYPGSVWNTMPAHQHDRRNEVYFYFDIAEQQAVCHFMGEPKETRHLFVQNEQAVLSPPWSIHCGCGTSSYAFIWGMAGENLDYDDMDKFPASELRQESAMKLLKTLPLVVLTGLFLLAGCSDNAASDDKVVLRLGHTLDTQHSVHKAMVFFGERLAVLSNGEMDVKIYPGSQLGTEREMIELLQIGSLSMTKVSASPLEGFAPAMKIFSIPYIFRDNDHYWTVLNSSVGKDLLTGVEDFKLKGLAYYDAGSRSFYTNDKPIHSPADLAGMKIRVLNSPTAVQTVRELGAAATPVSWGELYTALQQGVVDGAENNPPSYYLSRHYEIARYYSLDEHTSVPDVMLMSLRTWENLNPQQQQWVATAMAESVVFQREAWQASTKESLEKVIADGVEVIYPDKGPFVEAVKPFHDSLRGTEIGALIEQIKAM